MHKKISILVWTICLFALSAAIIGVTFIETLDIRSFAETQLTQTLGRRVSIGGLHITWQNPLTIDITNLHVANPTWADEPDMLRAGHIVADIDLWPLLSGVIQYRQLKLEDFSMLLERDARGVGNWRLDGKPRDPNAASPHGGLAVIPKNRTQFPNLLNAQLKCGELRLKTSSGKMLTLTADDFAFMAENGNTPVHIILDGTYNKTKTQIDIHGDSFAALRSDAPYNISFKITTPQNKLDFNGTMTNPLDVDGSKGELQITSHNFGDLLALMDMQSTSNLPFNIVGKMTRDGDDWQLDNGNSKLGSSDFKGLLKLKEGARGQADTIGFNLSSDYVDVKTISDSFSSVKFVQSKSFTQTADAIFDAALAAKEIQYQNLHVYHSNSHLTMHSGQITLDVPRAQFMGGQTTFKGAITTQNDIKHYEMTASILAGKIEQLIKLFGGKSAPMRGPFDMLADITMNGKNWRAAIKNSNGNFRLSMKQGVIAQNLLEKASVDLRSLIRKNDTESHINCLLGMATLNHGIAAIDPFELHTSTVNLNGYGKVNLPHQSINILLQSDGYTSGSFALDTPFRLTGPISNIGITPAFGEHVTASNHNQCGANRLGGQESLTKPHD